MMVNKMQTQCRDFARDEYRRGRLYGNGLHKNAWGKFEKNAIGTEGKVYKTVIKPANRKTDEIHALAIFKLIP